MTVQFLLFLQTVLFVSVIGMHLTRKNSVVVMLYAVQSLVIAGELFYSSLVGASLLLLAVALATFLVKVVVPTYFFFGLIRKFRLHFSVSTYLSGPVTLVVLALFTAFSFSDFFRPLTVLAPASGQALLLAVAMMFVATFLIINRKGVLSQMGGVLSLENAIVAFAYVANLETSAGPQIGILFVILVWVAIATVFTSMIYEHFGSLDTSAMEFWKERPL